MDLLAKERLALNKADQLGKKQDYLDALVLRKDSLERNILKMKKELEKIQEVLILYDC